MGITSFIVTCLRLNKHNMHSGDISPSIGRKLKSVTIMNMNVIIAMYWNDGMMGIIVILVFLEMCAQFAVSMVTPHLRQLLISPLFSKV